MHDPGDFALDDVLRLRKPHACGGSEWRVVRLGADIGLRCLTCNRRVLLPRSELARRVKALVHREPGAGGNPGDPAGSRGRRADDE